MGTEIADVHTCVCDMDGAGVGMFQTVYLKSVHSIAYGICTAYRKYTVGIIIR
jgi:hypothetical protein